MSRHIMLTVALLLPALLSAQPLERTHYPSWLSVIQVAKSVEVNGLRQTIYTYHSKNTHEATHDYFDSLLAQLANDGPLSVNRADTEFVHTQSVFIPPYFVTVAHETEQLELNGNIAIIDLSKTNHSWDQATTGVVPQRGLQLIQRTTASTTDPFETWVFAANATPASVSQSLKIQLVNSGWQPIQSPILDSTDCQFSDWSKQRYSLWISICPSNGIGSAIVMVRGET